jgi:hypothetical protein
VRILKGLKRSEFVSADSKRVTGAFSVSADCKGLNADFVAASDKREKEKARACEKEWVGSWKPRTVEAALEREWSFNFMWNGSTEMVTGQ